MGIKLMKKEKKQKNKMLLEKDREEVKKRKKYLLEEYREIAEFKFSEKATTTLNNLFDMFLTKDKEVMELGISLVDTYFRGLPNSFFVGLTSTRWSQHYMRNLPKGKGAEFVIERIHKNLCLNLEHAVFINKRKGMARKEAIINKLNKINKNLSR